MIERSVRGKKGTEGKGKGTEGNGRRRKSMKGGKRKEREAVNDSLPGGVAEITPLIIHTVYMRKLALQAQDKRNGMLVEQAYSGKWQNSRMKRTQCTVYVSYAQFGLVTDC